MSSMMANIFYKYMLLVSILGTAASTTPKMNFKECLENDNMITAVIKISLMKCLEECVMRPACLSLNYRRGYTKCEILSVSHGSFVATNGHTGPCVHILRSDIVEPKYPTNCACAEQESCLPENGSCEVKECPKLEIPNATIQGNMKNLGARVHVTCVGELYVEETGRTNIQCQANGQWDYVPKCIIQCPELEIPNVVLQGNTMTVGSVLYVTCASELYSEETGRTSIQCQSNGQWDYVPNCVIVCPEIDNPTLLITDDTRTAGAQIAVTCASVAYYEETGRTTILCQSNGQWDYAPNCISRYVGCYQDNRNRDLLPYAEIGNNHMTTELCINHCAGYNYAGTQSHSQCFCGNTLDANLARSEEECNRECKGDATQICGGHWRGSVYKLT